MGDLEAGEDGPSVRDVRVAAGGTPPSTRFSPSRTDIWDQLFGPDLEEPLYTGLFGQRKEAFH